MGRIGAWCIGLVFGALALWGLGFLAPIDQFWDDSHAQVREWVQPEQEQEESNDVETTIALQALFN